MSSKMMGIVAYLANFFLLTISEEHCVSLYESRKNFVKTTYSVIYSGMHLFHFTEIFYFFHEMRLFQFDEIFLEMKSTVNSVLEAALK